MSNKVELIKKIIADGREEDIYKLIVGISEYSLIEKHERSPIEEKKMRYTAEAHLNYVIKFGYGEKTQKIGKIKYFPYNEEFEEWLENGAPGILEEEINNYLADNPFK